MAFLCLLSCIALLRVSSGLWEPASLPELSIRPRIINGQEARPGTWPWHVALLSRSGVPRCGGSLINHNWVITAAHCNFTRAYRVVVGLHDLRSPYHSQELRISQVFRHPKFNLSTLHSDIALLKLNSGVHFNSKVSPVFLPHVDDQFFPRSLCKIMGWGFTIFNGTTYPNKLHEATVTITHNDRCKDYWHDIWLDIMLCAGGRGVSSAVGDSGGSLVCLKKGVWTLAGIVSYSDRSTPTRIPFVATRVSAFIPWIEEIVAHNSP